jgi:hypothetical protein
VNGFGACYVQFNITNVGAWTLDLKSGDGSVVKGDGEAKPDLVITVRKGVIACQASGLGFTKLKACVPFSQGQVGDDDFASLYEGKLNAQQVR